MAQKFSLRLVIDEEKNKVVLAEVGKDFVDVLFSLMTLPMGTIMSFLEKHRKSETVTFGCFGNLYRSVMQVSTNDFETEACKKMLLYPRSVREVQCKSLKSTISPMDVKFFRSSCFSNCNMCSNFSTSWCRCGGLMNQEIHLSDAKVVENSQNGVVFTSRSSFIVTDDLRLEVRSTKLVFEKLKSLGYDDLSKLREKVVDIGFEEVLTLLECTFSSNAPLTKTFLNKQVPTKFFDLSSPCVKKNERDAENVITFSVFLRKQDMKILFVECGEDFIDLLFLFLALPLDYLLEISRKSSTIGCIGNLFKSFNILSANETTEELTSETVLPHFYRCEKQLLDIITEQPPVYYGYKVSIYYMLTTDSSYTPSYSDDKLAPVVLMDPKSHGSNQSKEGSGFMKRGTKFNVSDDLIVTPMTSSSAFCLLKKLQIHAKDLEVQEVSISKTEATSLLRASLVTPSALNTAFKNLVLKKKPKEEC